MDKWNLINSNRLVDSKWIQVDVNSYAIGDNEKIDDYYIVHKPDYVILIVKDHDDIIFANQFRPGVQDFVLNFPLGLIEKRETPEIAARRELKEELGYQSNSLNYLGEILPGPAYITARGHVFSVDVTGQTRELKDEDPYEQIELVPIPRAQLLSLVASNKIQDASTLSAISKYFSHNKL